MIFRETFPDLKELGNVMTRVTLKQKYSWRERAKIMCILNKWQTPKCLNMRRPLTEKEIGPMMRHFRETISRKAFLMYWNYPSRKNNFGMEIE